MWLRIVTFFVLFSSFPAWGITLGESVQKEDYAASGPQNSVVAIQIKYSEPKSFVVLRKNYCSGAIISRRQIVTAAHCFLKQIDFLMQARVVFGPNADHEGFFSEILRNAQIEIHPQYNFKQSPESSKNLENDFAVVTLLHDLPAEAIPVLLPKDGASLVPQMPVQLVGYGASHFEKGSEQSDDIGQLRKASGLISQINGATFQIAQQETSGICKGDSGSPALLNREGQWIMVGVARSVTPGKRSDLCRGTGNFLSLQHLLEWKHD